MTDGVERRKYQRCDNIVCKAVISTDGITWDSFEVSDISAGGLRFVTSRYFSEDTKLFFNIYVYNMLSEFNLKFEGNIIREEENKGVYSYAVKFDNVDKYTLIQLDELIRTKITLTNTDRSVYEDGTYAFVFVPKSRPKRLSMHL